MLVSPDPDPLRCLEISEAYYLMCKVLGKLPFRESLVLAARYEKGLTLEATGKLIGVNRERVRQIETAAVRRLRFWGQKQRRLENVREEIYSQ